MNAELNKRIGGWEPADPRPFDEGLVAFIRATVIAAGPRRWEEARNGLKWGFAYLLWAVAPGFGCDARGLFAADQIDIYNAAMLSGPKGTRDAMVSVLKRLHPDVGFAGTTRQPGPAAIPVSLAVPSDIPRVVRAADRVMSAEVEATITGYVPTLLDRSAWVPVAAFVRAVVRTVRPLSVQRARHLCRDLAYLAVWARGDHRVLAVDTTLTAGTIETFLTVLVRGGLPARSVASFAANLHLVREVHDLVLDVPRRTFAAPDPKAPYNQAEIDQFFEVAARIPHAARRRHVRATLNLLFGVGALPGEIAYLEPDHITTDNAGRVIVTLIDPARTVIVLDRYAAELAAAKGAAAAAGDRYLIGGIGEVRKNRLTHVLGAKSDASWQVDVDPTRTRATWLVESAATPGWYPTIVEHLTATGLTTLTRIDGLWPYIVERHQELTALARLNTATNDTTPVDGDTDSAEVA